MQKKPYFACLLAHPLHFLASLNSKSTSKFSSNVLFTMLGIQNCHLYPKPTRHTSTAVSPLFFMHTFVVIFTKQIHCKSFTKFERSFQNCAKMVAANNCTIFVSKEQDYTQALYSTALHSNDIQIALFLISSKLPPTALFSVLFTKNC